MRIKYVKYTITIDCNFYIVGLPLDENKNDVSGIWWELAVNSMILILAFHSRWVENLGLFAPELAVDHFCGAHSEIPTQLVPQICLFQDFSEQFPFKWRLFLYLEFKILSFTSSFHGGLNYLPFRHVLHGAWNEDICKNLNSIQFRTTINYSKI